MVQTDRERRYDVIETRAQTIEAAQRDLVDDRFALDERERVLEKRFDALIEHATDTLDSDEFYEIFGTHPDESGKPDKPADDPPPAPYATLILGSLAEIGLENEGFDPRHIEAFMRGTNGTLDHLSRPNFIKEVRRASACLAAAGAEYGEAIAKSHGL